MFRSLAKSFVILGALLATASGCGQTGAAYTPSQHEASQALEASLTAWRDGKSPKDLESLSPPLHPVDSEWQAGKRLERFEILKEEPSAEAAKIFVVRLGMKEPATAKDARFIVIGRNPVWVYREEDYAHVLNMDNDPAASKFRAQSAPRKRTR